MKNRFYKWDGNKTITPIKKGGVVEWRNTRKKEYTLKHELIGDYSVTTFFNGTSAYMWASQVRHHTANTRNFAFDTKAEALRGHKKLIKEYKRFIIKPISIETNRFTKEVKSKYISPAKKAPQL